MRKVFLLAFFLIPGFAYNYLQAQVQPFVLVQSAGLPDLAHSWVSWGDYDKDGDLDIAVCGDSALIPRTYVYRNDNGFFFNTGFVIPQLTSGSVEWGDADNDGWLDLLITGKDASENTKAYIVSNTNGVLSTNPVPLPFAVSYGQAHWGDFDNDGRLDILMAGNFSSKILHNKGNLDFSAIAAPLPLVNDASCNWVDYNNDGQPDVFVCGHVDVGDVSVLFRNDHGTFTPVSVMPSGITGMSYGNSRWADLDQDGDMDLLISGVDTVVGYILIYENKGNDVFEKIDNYTFNSFATNMDVADYDNDGKPDFIVTGKLHSCGGSAITLLYHNEGGMMFNNFYTDITGIAAGGTAFADYNNDGFTDLLLSGTDNNDLTATRLYRNTSGTYQYFTNTPPDPPSGLLVRQNGNTVKLKWNKASDSETPSEGLTYNILIGSDADTMDVFSPMSLSSSGFRLVASRGNTGQDTAWTITGLSEGTYYWSVQTIDNGFMPSVFATVQSFQFTPTGITEENTAGFNFYPNPCVKKLFVNIPIASDASVSVYNSRGLLEKYCLFADGIDVSLLPSGLHYARIQAGNREYHGTFLKR